VIPLPDKPWEEVDQPPVEVDQPPVESPPVEAEGQFWPPPTDETEPLIEPVQADPVLHHDGCSQWPLFGGYPKVGSIVIAHVIATMPAASDEATMPAASDEATMPAASYEATMPAAPMPATKGLPVAFGPSQEVAPAPPPQPRTIRGSAASSSSSSHGSPKITQEAIAAIEKICNMPPQMREAIFKGWVVPKAKNPKNPPKPKGSGS